MTPMIEKENATVSKSYAHFSLTSQYKTYAGFDSLKIHA